MRNELKEIQFADVRDSEIIRYCYQNVQNYKVVDNPKATGNVCMLFVSSNSIYFPNTEEAVAKSLVEHDRFEWFNLAQLEPLQSAVARLIFIRDVYKQWYISGINEEIDGVDKLASFLKELIDGFSLVIVGNSSGGYLSALLATKLQAERAFSISGQWDIRDQEQKAPFVKAEANNGYDYINIVDLLSSNIPIFYLYPARCKWDREQAEIVRTKKNIIHIPFNQEGHGATCYGFNLPWLFMMENNALTKLSENAPEGGWKRISFLFNSMGILKGTRLLANYYVHKLSRIRKAF